MLEKALVKAIHSRAQRSKGGEREAALSQQKEAALSQHKEAALSRQKEAALTQQVATWQARAHTAESQAATLMQDLKTAKESTVTAETVG